MPNSNSISNEKTNNFDESSNFFKVLISSFSTIFLAELGDKTQIATLFLSAQSGRPLIIFLAAALALICTSLLGVIIGRWIANNLPRHIFTMVCGLIMLCLGIYLSVQGGVEFFQNQIMS
tara:strand:+ start:2085 stop:2444 length:360 start_codon:yes stop_codon:yes gene_type:complete